MKNIFAKNPLVSLFRYTWKYSFDTKRNAVFFIVLSVIGNGIYLLQPVVAGKIFDAIQFSSGSPNLVGAIFRYLAMFILINLGFWAFHGTSRVIERSNAFLVRKNYKKEMFDKVMDLPAAWHKDHHSGDTIDKINKAGESLFGFSSTIFIVIQGVLRMAGSTVILFFFDWRAGLVALGVSAVAIAVILGFDRKLIKGYEIVFRHENKLAAAIHDYVTNVVTVITLRLKKRVSQEIETRALRPFSVFKRNAVLNECKWFSASFLISLMTVLVLGMNAYSSFKTSGVVAAGTLFVLYQYLGNVGGTFFNFASQYGEMVIQNTALKSAEVLNEAHASIERKSKILQLPKWKTLLVKNLYFVYEDAEQGADLRENHIEDVSVKIEKNSRIAFIGESGSGKSTLLYLLRGLYAPQKVKLYADGTKLEGGLGHIYDHVTLVPQEPETFNSTIEDNITMGLTAKKHEIEEAVRIARFKNVLDRLPSGLKTNVMEKGVNLSGGEKQRLALARGILATRDSEFLFMDEPTSSVDTENEILIYEGIFKKFKDKTIISSVHRLHLLPRFDYIYFFKNGKLLTEGTFRTLLEDEYFKILWEKYKNNQTEKKA